MQNTIRLLIIISFSVLSFTMTAQEQINGSFPFQTDPSKDYSIFIPSGYSDDTPTAAFLALHPLNPVNWDGRRWCEEIADFAEANNVILICPDGGTDGAIDDPIDTAFTTVMIDSAMTWYSIAPDSLYAMGFSWGGKTTYTYGLNHVNKFAGFMPIGAATSVNDLNGIADQALEKPFYLIHGGNDSPNVRFYPMIERLESEGAFVESNLLPGVGHTIWFPNQVEILTVGYDWLKANSVTTVDVENEKLEDVSTILSKENYAPGMPLQFTDLTNQKVNIYSMDGSLVTSGSSVDIKAPIQNGVYVISIGNASQKFMVTE